MNMKKYISALTISACLAAPLAVNAATPQTTANTPAAKGISSQTNTTGIVFGAISPTASPATNKAVREESNKLAANSTITVVPVAHPYFIGDQVAVTPIALQGAYVNVTYPDVRAFTPKHQNAINTVIVNYISGLINQLNTTNATASDRSNLYVMYNVSQDDKGIFTLTLYSYVIQDKAATPVVSQKTFTFNIKNCTYTEQ